MTQEIQIEVPRENLTMRLPSIHVSAFDIRDLSATPTSMAATTAALRSAIETCSAAGGGMVVVPPGTWETGPIELRSHVNLHVSENAKLILAACLRTIFLRFSPGGAESNA